MKGNSLQYQVKGNHYKSMSIQPVEFALVNDLNTCQANIIKYVCRYRMKDGVSDLNKASHYCDLWIDIYEAHGKAYNQVPPLWIPVEDFISYNNLSHSLAVIIRLICLTPNPHRINAAKGLIKELIDEIKDFAD